MNINKEDIYYVAKLARLEIKPEEVEEFRKDMEQIIHYVNKLNEIDTKEVEATSYVQKMNNVFRDDIVKKSYSREKILKNAPSTEEGYINVPNVVDNK